MEIILKPFAIRRLDKSDEARAIAERKLIAFAKDWFGALIWPEVEHLYRFSHFDDHGGHCTAYSSVYDVYENPVPLAHSGSPSAGPGWPL